MNPHDKSVIHGSAEAAWRTPDPLFEALDGQFHFAVDAAATRDNRKVRAYYGPDHRLPELRDAQRVPWHRYAGPVFLNPPYSRDLLRTTGDASFNIAVWAEKCAREAALGATVVAVLPASTQTEWWYQYVRHGAWKAHEIREIPHRVSFLRPDGSAADNAGGNTAVVIWQPNYGYVGDWVPIQRVWTWKEGY